MKIGQTNNVNFGAYYYEGYHKDKLRNIDFHFETRDCRPKDYLTKKQNKVSEVIEDIIDKTKVTYYYINDKKSKYKIRLDKALNEQNTDIYFRYPNKDKVDISIVKWGKGFIGDEYSYNPYNKKGNKRIQTSFSLKEMPTIKSIKEKTDQFITDCVDFLSDNNNPKNQKIDNELWEKF